MLLLAITMLAGMEVGNGSRYGYEGDEFDNVGRRCATMALLIAPCLTESGLESVTSAQGSARPHMWLIVVHGAR